MSENLCDEEIQLPWDDTPQLSQPWIDNPPFLPSRNGSTYPSHPRPSSRASSFGSIDSGASNPPRTARRPNNRTKRVDFRWNEFEKQPISSTLSDRGSRGSRTHSPDSVEAVGKRRRIDGSPDELGSSGYGSNHKSTEAFACPFYRKNPFEHMECMSRRLLRVRDVKQHIYRRHVQDCCNRCHGLFSPPLVEPDVQSCACIAREHSSTTRRHGASLEAQELLKNRSDRRLSQTEQWYGVWDILFKDVPRPSTPYLGTLVHETMEMLREFWRKEGASITAEITLGDVTQPSKASEDLQRVMMDMLEKLEQPLEWRAHELKVCTVYE